MKPLSLICIAYLSNNISDVESLSGIDEKLLLKIYQHVVNDNNMNKERRQLILKPLMEQYGNVQILKDILGLLLVSGSGIKEVKNLIVNFFFNFCFSFIQIFRIYFPLFYLKIIYKNLFIYFFIGFNYINFNINSIDLIPKMSIKNYKKFLC